MQPGHRAAFPKYYLLAVLVTITTMTACGGGDADGGDAMNGGGGGNTKAEKADGGGDASDAGCPFTTSELAGETGQVWTQRGPLEGELSWLEGVRGVSCVYGSEATDGNGDSLFILRTDSVSGEHASAVRDDFRASCGEAGGEIRTSASTTGASWCENGDLVENGIVDRRGEVVHISIVNDDDGSLGRSIESILGLI